MYCPKCGKDEQDAQNFCRSCGLDLRRVAIALDAELAPGELELPSRSADRRAFVAAILSLVIMFGGFILTIAGKKIAHDEIIAVVGTIATLFGMFMLLASVMWRAWQARSAQAAPSRTGAIGGAERRALPSARFAMHVPSVTEGTTRNMAAPVRREPSDELPA